MQEAKENVLNQCQEVLENYHNQIATFIKSQYNNHLEYQNSIKNRLELGFNAFALTSDTYYRENYHSYILYNLLNPASKHNEGNTYVFQFIELLNGLNKAHKINYSSFQNATVDRELANIDILIKDDVSKKAIIIENKINNAGDQYRQLPNYYHWVSKTHEVVAIVYLPLDAYKTPSKNDWTEEEISTIDKLLYVIPAFHSDATKVNLYHHWLIPSMGASKYADNTFILKHYGELIKYLNTKNMNTETLDNFRETLLQDDNYKTLESINKMFRELPEYLASRVQERYQQSHEPFPSIFRHAKIDVVFDDFRYNDEVYKLDVWCFESKYELIFWERNGKQIDIREHLKSTLPQLEEFDINDERLYAVKKEFSFSQEPEMFEFIDGFLKTLKDLK